MNNNKNKSNIIFYISLVLIMCVISIVIKPVVVCGESMDNTLQDRDYLIVNKLAYGEADHPGYEDIIVFNSNIDGEKLLIKRVIGIEGDVITIRNGEVYRNNTRLKEDYANAKTTGNMTCIIPEDKVFVLGDNRSNSLDSRSAAVGFVSENDIVGEAVLRVMPFSKRCLF